MRRLPEAVERQLIAQLFQVRDEIKAQLDQWHAEILADAAQVNAEIAELRDDVRRLHAIEAFSRELDAPRLVN